MVATYRDEAGRERLQALATGSGSLSLCPLDVRDASSIERFAHSLNGLVVDVLVNNAGVMGPEQRGLEGVDYEAWASVLAVNVLGPLHVTTALLPSLRKSKSPRVIALSSIMGCLHRKSSGYYAYRSSKAALNKVMQLLAHDLAQEQIVACPVNPGWVRTEMGGADAPLSVQECARGLTALIDRLSMEHSGRFWQWDGSELAW